MCLEPRHSEHMASSPPIKGTMTELEVNFIRHPQLRLVATWEFEFWTEMEFAMDWMNGDLKR